MNTISHFNCNLNVIDVCDDKIAHESCEDIHPLSELPRESLERISQILVEQQTAFAHIGVPKPLASSPVELSSGMSLDSLVCNNWKWQINERSLASGQAAARYTTLRHATFSMSQGQGAAQAENARNEPHEPTSLLLVSVLINDTRHLERLSGNNSSTPSSMTSS